MGKRGSLNEGVLKKILLSYAYVGIWIFLSFTVIIFNKYILDRKIYEWPYPISLTLIHMSFCSALAFILINVLHVVKPVSISHELFLTSVVPIGAIYSFSLCLSNSAYIYLSVSFIQMFKALMRVTFYLIGVALKKDAFNGMAMLNMLSISLGVAVAAEFDALGGGGGSTCTSAPSSKRPPVKS